MATQDYPSRSISYRSEYGSPNGQKEMDRSYSPRSSFSSNKLSLIHQPTAADIMEQRRVRKNQTSMSWHEDSISSEQVSGRVGSLLQQELMAQHTKSLQDWFELETKDRRMCFETVYEKLDDLMERLDCVEAGDRDSGGGRFSRIAALGQPRKPQVKAPYPSTGCLKDVASTEDAYSPEAQRSLADNLDDAPPPQGLTTKDMHAQVSVGSVGSGKTKKVEVHDLDVVKMSSNRSIRSLRSFGGRSLAARTHSNILDGVGATAMSKIARAKRGKMLNKIWSFLEEPSPGSWSALYVRWSSCLVILSSLFTIVHYEGLHGILPVVLDFSFDLLFSLEITLRFVACPSRLRFFCEVHNWVDICSGALPLIMRSVAEFLLADHSERQDSALHVSLFCFVPVVRFLKLLRHFEQFHLLLRAFQVAFEALPVLFYTQAVLILGFGSLMYMAEPRDNIPTLALSYWFAIVTMSSVGYGETVPVTWQGHLITSALIICGSLYMAIPVGIVGNAFHEVWGERDRLLVMRRMRNRLLMSGYTAEDIPALFAIFDLDKSGDLTVDEFSKMMQNMNVTIDDARLRKLFQALDADGGGSIDDQEFVRELFPSAYAEIYGPKEPEELDDELSSPQASRQESPTAAHA